MEKRIACLAGGTTPSSHGFAPRSHIPTKDTAKKTTVETMNTYAWSRSILSRRTPLPTIHARETIIKAEGATGAMMTSVPAIMSPTTVIGASPWVSFSEFHARAADRTIANVIESSAVNQKRVFVDMSTPESLVSSHMVGRHHSVTGLAWRWPELPDSHLVRPRCDQRVQGASSFLLLFCGYHIPW
jgi:hypothetical protein